MRVRKSSPLLVICSLYFEVLLYVPRISNQQHLEPTELTTSLSTQINHMGRINLEPPQATASKHWSPHNIPIKVWVGVRVECDHNHVFVVFPAAVVDNNVYTGTAKQQ